MNLSLNDHFDKLRSNKLSMREYQRLHTQCSRLVKKACRRYKIDRMLHNPVIKSEIVDNICTTSLVKTIKGYNKSKGSFTTYFYYKACSAARSEAGKLKRRIKVNNTIPLDNLYNI